MTNTTTLLERLVAIDSTNPDLVPGAAGEARLGTFVAAWLTQAGCDVAVQPVTGRRSNVVAVVRGSGGGRTLMLNSHLDTVGAAGMPEAHTPAIRNGRLYGRGAGDTKAGLAAAMCALRHVASWDRLRGDVILAGVIDEEAGSKGTEALLRQWRADAGIVLEPTGLAIQIAHKGFVWLTVAMHGVAAHGSRPDLGVDAIAKLGRVIVEIEELDRRLRSGRGDPLLGTGSIHCSLVEGGSELSSYPASATLRLERRTIPGEPVDMVADELQEILDRVMRSDASARGELRIDFGREPLAADRAQPIVDVLLRHASAELGEPPEVVGGSGWTDASLLNSNGIPSIIFGPSAEGIHGPDESVDLESMEACSRVLEATAREFCN